MKNFEKLDLKLFRHWQYSNNWKNISNCLDKMKPEFYTKEIAKTLSKNLVKYAERFNENSQVGLKNKSYLQNIFNNHLEHSEKMYGLSALKFKASHVLNFLVKNPHEIDISKVVFDNMFFLFKSNNYYCIWTFFNKHKWFDHWQKALDEVFNEEKYSNVWLNYVKRKKVVPDFFKNWSELFTFIQQLWNSNDCFEDEVFQQLFQMSLKMKNWGQCKFFITSNFNINLKNNEEEIEYCLNNKQEILTALFEIDRPKFLDVLEYLTSQQEKQKINSLLQKTDKQDIKNKKTIL